MRASLCALEKGDGKRWDAYVHRNPDAGHCHLSGWAWVMTSAYGHKAPYLWVCDEEGRVRGVLPLVEMRSLLLRRSLVSLPFMDDGGILADDEEVAQALLQKAVQLAQSEHAETIDLRHRSKRPLGLASYGEKVTLALNLSGDPELMWKGFSAKVRNQVRKARKSGLSVSWHKMDGLEDFYRVFSVNMRALGSPVHSRRLFSEILTHFEGSAGLILVRRGEMTVAGGLALFFKKTMSIPWASSLRSLRSQCPNHLLYWEAIRWACERGLGRFDFGRSSPGSGTYRFKKQWGALEEGLCWESWGSGGGLAIQSDDPRFNLLAKTWSRLPLWVTRAIGPLIRGRLSN